MGVKEDIFGFSVEARCGLDRYQRGPCLKLMIHLYDAAQTTGRHYDDSDHQVHTDVMAGKIPCPLQDTCQAYARAIERGGTPLHLKPTQLSFANLMDK